jgi:ABC-type uncharacterized transport system involved in gliding motility auxiliary subunit
MKKYLQKLDIVGLLLLVAAVIWYWVSNVSNVWGKWNLSLAIAGLALFAIGVAANYRQILASLGKRSTKYAGNFALSLILVIAIVSGINYISQRHVKRWDTTGSGRFTLAPQTIQVLEKLAKDVEIKAFFPGGDHRPLKELLIDFRAKSSRIHFQFIDADKQPDVARNYKITTYGNYLNRLTGEQLKYGTIIVTYDNRNERIEKRNVEVREEDLTNAIIRANRKEAKKIYFIQGHGEKDAATVDNDPSGLSEAKKKLEDQGYKVEDLNLAASSYKIPDDARVLIEAGPTTELFPQELEIIRGFSAKGGVGLLILIDPPPAPSLEPLLKDWGAQADNDLIVFNDNDGNLLGGSAVEKEGYERHKITENFSLTTLFPAARSVQPMKSVPDGVTVEALFKSNQNTWGETNLKQKPSFDPKTDFKGPLPIAVAATKEIKPSSDTAPAIKSRMVVVGTSSFPINALYARGGNGDLFQNMVSWLAQDEDLISIRPKPPENRPISMTQKQMLSVLLITTITLPGIALIVGIAVVMKRRRK